MKVKTIRSSWWEGYGYRLDCQPYLQGALETKVILEALPGRKDIVGTLTSGANGGIYQAGRDKIQWVETPEFGIPCLGSMEILKADLSNLPLISTEQVRRNPLFLVRKGWILITRSGTIGRLAYVRGEMDGMACQDVLRIVPDIEKILPGYLYAFLSSKFGVPLVTSGTYGAIIQHLEPKNIADIPVPRFDSKLERKVHDSVEEAASLRTNATAKIKAAQKQLTDYFGQPPVPVAGKRHPRFAGQGVRASSICDNGRLDALYFNPVATDLDAWIEDHRAGYWSLNEVGEVFDVPPFKHIYVETEEGVGFFTSADIFLIDKKPDKFLSKVRTKGLQKYVLKKGWVLLARSGSLGGNIATPQFADSAMHEQTASDHVIRIASKSSECLPGYLYAYLSLPQLGYPLILRTATGACVPALWPLYLNRLKVLKPSKELNNDVDKQVQDAFEMRVRATALEDKARANVEEAIEAQG